MFPVCRDSGRVQPSCLQLCFQHMKFYIILRTSGKSALRCFNSRLSRRKSVFNLFSVFPVGRTLLAHPPGHCPPLVLQVTCLSRLPYLCGCQVGRDYCSLIWQVHHWHYPCFKYSCAALYGTGTQQTDFLKKLTSHLQSKINGLNFWLSSAGLTIESWWELLGAGFSWKSAFNYGCSAEKPGWREDDSWQHYSSNFGTS